ncbi:hypothetical protein C8J56DRAFT_791086 [Mycena floridula]|nr:hypothetical protein C8J56DRAFT_791086 [Mycena floridula]
MSAIDIKEINESYFNACNFESLMRGIHFAVYVSALSKICQRTSGRARLLMALLISVLFILSTIHNATYWAYVHQAFIAHGETAQSTADYINSYPPWFTGITSVSDANAVLADCIIVSTHSFFELSAEDRTDLANMGCLGWNVANYRDSYHHHNAHDRFVLVVRMKSAR